MVGNMRNKEIQLKKNMKCTFRQPLEDDAQNMLDYLNMMCTETDFIAFGKGELPWNLEEKRKFIKEHHDDNNKIIIVAEILIV